MVIVAVPPLAGAVAPFTVTLNVPDPEPAAGETCIQATFDVADHVTVPAAFCVRRTVCAGVSRLVPRRPNVNAVRSGVSKASAVETEADGSLRSPLVL